MGKPEKKKPRREPDDESPGERPKGNVGLWIALGVGAVLLLCCVFGGGGTLVFYLSRSKTDEPIAQGKDQKEKKTGSGQIAPTVDGLREQFTGLVQAI